MTTPQCPHCECDLIELKNFDWKCEKCKKEFELFHAGFVEPNLREVKK